MPAAQTIFDSITEVSGPAAFNTENWIGTAPTFINTANKAKAGGPALLQFWRQNPVAGCEKAFECACTERFTKGCDVVRHLKNKHFGGKMFKCNHCELTSTNTSNLNGAHQKQHQEAPEMDKCGWLGCTAKPMKDRSQFYKHIVTHEDSDFTARERERVSGKVAAPRAQRMMLGTKAATSKRPREDSTLQGEAGSEEELAAAGSSQRKRARGSANSTTGSLRAPAGALQGVAGVEEMARMPTSPVDEFGRPLWRYQPAAGFGDVPVNPELLAMDQVEVLLPRAVAPVSQDTLRAAQVELPSAGMNMNGEDWSVFGGQLETSSGWEDDGHSGLQVQSSSQQNQLVEPTFDDIMMAAEAELGMGSENGENDKNSSYYMGDFGEKEN